MKMGCDTACDGTSALEALNKRVEQVKQGQANMYKLILVDYHMPDMTGAVVAAQIREIL